MSDNPFNNPDFRKEMGELLDEKISPISKRLDTHADFIKSHEQALQQAKGARWSFGIVWTLVVALGEWLAHRH